MPADASPPSDEPRPAVGLDALREAVIRRGHVGVDWRSLLEARAGGVAGVWVVALLAALALGVGVVALVHSGARPSAPEPVAELPMAPGADTTTASGDASAGSDPARASLVVQVAGAVRHPGVFHMASGSRLGDLVQRAGGLTADADSDRIDLAAPLADGALVYLPRRGEALPPGPVVDGGAGSTPGDGGSASLSVDLNTATAAQLDALPGVGPTTAAAIVAYRQQHGPFHSLDDLADVTGIGPSKLAQIRPHAHL